MSTCGRSNGASDTCLHAQQPQAVQLLTDLAQVAPVPDVRTAGKHLAHVVDPDGSLADCQHQFDRRYLTLAPLMDGMTALDGLLDAEAAALLTAALEPFLVPADRDDRRTASQRRADGLVQIVQSATDQALLPVVGGERPHLQVIVDPRRLHPMPRRRSGCCRAAAGSAAASPRRAGVPAPGERGPGRLRRPADRAAPRRARRRGRPRPHPATVQPPAAAAARRPRRRLPLARL